LWFQGRRYTAPFPDLSSSPWKSWKSIESAYRRAPVKKPYKFKEVVLLPSIRAERRKQSWFEEDMDKLDRLDDELKEKDIRQKLLTKRKGKKRSNAEVEEEDEE
jgi:hypothetical protein